MSFFISGTGSALPEQIITNDDLAAFLDTSDQWIKTRTGIAQRRVLKDETLLDITVKAGQNALDSAGLSPKDIDLLICTTVQGEYITPSLSCLAAKRLGIDSPRVFDINMGCTAFIYALDMADSYFKAQKAGHALIICAEGMSKVADWTDRATCVLFGDGAGAAALSRGEGFVGLSLHTDGGAEHLNIPQSAGNCPFCQREAQASYLHMNGQEIYKFAVSAIARDIRDILQRNGLSPDDISYFLLHQANLRIIESAMQKLGQSKEKFPHNLEKYGNTSSATIPILIDELARGGALKEGDRLVLCAFGAGLTDGACLIDWHKAGGARRQSRPDPA